MDHRSKPRTPPRELQLPSAVVPPRRRRTPRRRLSPRQATIPAVPAPAALHFPSAPRKIQALLAIAGAADADDLMLLANTVVSAAQAKAEAASPPVPPPVGENLRSSPPLPPAAADEDKPCAPPLPPLAVEEPQSSLSMGRGHAATKARAEDCKKAACPKDIAGSSKGDQSSGGVASPAAGVTPMQLGDDDMEREPGEIPPEKPAAGCNAFPAHGPLLGKEEMVAAGEEEAMTIAREPAATGSTGVVVASEGKAAAEMSAAEQKRMREVFVGGLSRDATTEKDVRAALSAAGEITEVRMIRDRTTREKNKGYCFVAYRDPTMARKAVAEFGNLKICGKACRVAVPEGNQKTNKIAQRDPIIEDNRIYEQGQPSPTLPVDSSYITSWDGHARHQNNKYAIIPASSYAVLPAVAIPAGYYFPMYDNGKGAGVYLPVPPSDLNHGLAGPSG